MANASKKLIFFTILKPLWWKLNGVIGIVKTLSPVIGINLTFTSSSSFPGRTCSRPYSKDESPFTRSLVQGRPKPPLASPLHSACFPLPCSQESTMESRAGGQHACIHIPTTFPWGGRASKLLPSGSPSRLRDAVATGKAQGILEQK